MSDSVNVEFKELGIVEGLMTVEVIDADTGQVIGYNQTAVEDTL